MKCTYDEMYYYYYTKIPGTRYIIIPGTYLEGFWPWRLTHHPPDPDPNPNPNPNAMG